MHVYHLLYVGVESISKEVEALRNATQNEMLLSEESAPAAVLDELQQLQTQLQGYAEELARLNKFQRLFKVNWGDQEIQSALGPCPTCRHRSL